jgi:glycosyltransferase involved in cell wall biosynthesis
MKILELTNYSAGGCGVFARVKQESIELLNLGHDVIIFSSNLTKGSNQIAPPTERIDNLLIKRFPSKMIGGESYMKWDFENEARKFKPDVIIAHSYRHLLSHKAIKISNEIGAKVFLITHAPFVKDNSTRSFFSKLAVRFYDYFIGPKIISKFDRVIRITKWEEPYLVSLGVTNSAYIPNGIPDIFFNSKDSYKFNFKKILFLGRISPIKNLEILIKSFSEIKKINPKVELELVGPPEEPYSDNLKKISKNIIFSPPIYDLKKKIKKFKEADIFVLPSHREAMPQSLIEAMSLGKLVISSKTEGGKEIINDGVNGLLFDLNDHKSLTEKLLFSTDKNNINLIEKIRKQARKDSERFKWKRLSKEMEKIIRSQ